MKKTVNERLREQIQRYELAILILLDAAGGSVVVNDESIAKAARTRIEIEEVGEHTVRWTAIPISSGKDH